MQKMDEVYECDECWEKRNGNIDIFFSQGYAGAVKCEVRIGDVWYVIDKDEVKRVLLKAMTERGYTKSKTNRQKYERININD